MNELLTVRDLIAGYGNVRVLESLSFEVMTNEVLALVGSNGAGKTTLLRTLSGLIKPDRGSIDFKGTQLVGKSSSEIVGLRLSHAPEGRRVFGGMTVEENLRLGALRRHAKSRASIAAGLEEVYTWFPKLRERRGQLAGTMSGGEQQMCAIGRALMVKPELLMIDELSLGLAPIVVEELLNTLEDVVSEGCTVLLVEQDLSVALNFADRAIVMQSGRIVMSGPASAMKDDESIFETYLGGSQ